MLHFEETESNVLVATPSHGRFSGQTLQIKRLICKSPTCACREVTLSFFDPELDLELQKDAEPLASMTVDVVKKRLSTEKPSKNAADFVPNLTNEDWSLLLNNFYSYKNKITEAGDFNVNDFEFPIHDIEENGQLIGFRDILPYGESPYFAVDNSPWIADDSYCLRKNCDCTEALVTFLSKGSETKTIHPAVWINYETGKVNIDSEGEAEVIPAQQLYLRLLKQNPGLLQLLKNRRLKLFKLYQKYKRANSATPRAISIGRNDPCPCGSGKKFKKCCSV